MTRWPVIFALLATCCVTTLPGCTPPASEGDFHSPDPASKLYAITRAGETRDKSAVPHLVENLDSDDPAVRLFAISALEKITGDRRGYNPYAPADQRRAAIERWVAFAEGRGPSGSQASRPE